MRKTLLLASLISAKALALNTEELPIPAIIYPSEEASIASPMTGIIEKIPLKSGQTFKKDEPLLSFNCHKKEAILQQNEAIYEKKQVKLNGYSKLKSLNAVTNIDYIEAKSDLKEAKAALDVAKNEVSQCIIKAPFRGQMTKRFVNPHEYIEQGKPVFDIIGLDNYEIHVVAPSAWLKWLKIGMPFKIQLQELNQTFEAKVTRFNHRVDPISRTFIIYGAFSNKSQLVSAGMSGEAFFEGAP